MSSIALHCWGPHTHLSALYGLSDRSRSYQASRRSSDPTSTWSPHGWTARHEMAPDPPSSFLDSACEGERGHIM
jgi:hypothetical protein